MRFTARDGLGRLNRYDIQEIRSSRPVRSYRDEKKGEDLSELEKRLDKLEKEVEELLDKGSDSDKEEDLDEEDLDEEVSEDEDLDKDDDESEDEDTETESEEEEVVDLGDSVKKPLIPNYNRTNALKSVGSLAKLGSVNDSADNAEEDEIAKAWANRPSHKE